MRVKVILFLAAFVLLVSQGVSAQSVSVNRGMLRFESIAEYERYAENAYSREVIREVSRGSDQVTTMEESGENPQREGEDIYPEFLLSILNQDKIVNISGFLVKVDLENGRALAISDRDPEAYNLLLENRLDAAEMMVFSAEEENAVETLELIEAGLLSTRDYESNSSLNPAGRACPGAARYTDGDRAFLWDTQKTKDLGCNNGLVEYRMDNKAVYQKFIFYFSLQSKGKSMKGCTYSNWTLVPSYTAKLSLSGKVKYRKRCGGEIRETRSIPLYYNSVISWRPYEGSRSLSHYDFSVAFGSQHTWSNAPLVNSRIYNIRAGY